MAKFVLKDASVNINGTDLSQYCSSVTVEANADEVEFTGFGTSGYREFGQGLKDATISVTAFQTFGTAVGDTFDTVVQPLHASGGTFDVVVKPTSSAASPTNPSYTMRSRVYNYQPIAGGVGDASTIDVSFRNGGTSGLVRATA
jgi:hypothetical protein